MYNTSLTDVVEALDTSDTPTSGHQLSLPERSARDTAAKSPPNFVPEYV